MVGLLKDALKWALCIKFDQSRGSEQGLFTSWVLAEHRVSEKTSLSTGFGMLHIRILTLNRSIPIQIFNGEICHLLPSILLLNTQFQYLVWQGHHDLTALEGFLILFLFFDRVACNLSYRSRAIILYMQKWFYIRCRATCVINLHYSFMHIAIVCTEVGFYCLGTLFVYYRAPLVYLYIY